MIAAQDAAPLRRRFRCRSPGLRRLRHLPALLGGELVPWTAPPQPGDAVIGWGLKAWSRRDEAGAAALGLPFIRLEDGYIRSIGLGVAGAQPFSIVIDDLGIAYDATRPSRLEGLIAAAPEAAGAAERALIRRMVEGRVSKYNHAWAAPRLPPAGGRRRVLLIDQVRGDLSIGLGLADAGSFAAMLAAARRQHPGAELVVKTHPDVISGRRRGYLAGGDADLAGCTVLGEDCNPFELLLAVDEVYTVTSQMGFEALLAGRRVHCFGMPFYAGWGLTSDALACPRRGVRRSLEQVFHAAYQVYPRYVDPVDGEPCGLDRILDRIADHRRAMADGGGRCWCFGFSRRKRRFAVRFLPGADCRFAASARVARWRGARPGDRVIAWGMRGGGESEALAAALGTAVERMEDGFIRSVGLGSDFVRPASLVLDRRGIYFDPRTPSDLEHLLANHAFTDDERARGASLIGLLLKTGVTKYNLGERRRLDLAAAAGRPTVLVPGQVEDDQSVRTGCAGVASNAGLLAAVRAACPSAWIIYKPHPDVLARNRIGAVPAAATIADQVVEDLDMAACLDAVDEVHTMTSLTGFEALVRGKRVTAYGTPFYAGWGLTTDRLPCPRRGRRLAIEELVVGALVLYPRYLHPEAGLFTGPEAVIASLARGRRAPPAIMPRWRRWAMQAANALAAWR